MKKVIIGVVAITILTSATIVGANSLNGLVGKRVAAEATVYVNEKQVSDAIIIDGKSYAPVRDIVEAVGGSVSYKSAGGEGKASIHIEKKDSSGKSLETVLVSVENDLKTEKDLLAFVMDEIEKYTKQRDDQLAGLTDQTAIDAMNRKYEGFLNERQAQVESINKKISELEAKRDELRKQLEAAK